MPDWVARIVRTSIQVGLGTLVWAVVKVTLLKDTITPEQDLAVLALIGGVSIIAISAIQGAAETAGVIPTVLKPTNAKTARVAKPVRPSGGAQ